MYTSASNFVCGVIVPGLRQHLSTLHLVSLGAAQQHALRCLPLRPSSSSLRNISTPVHTSSSCVSLIPTISTSSPTLHQSRAQHDPSPPCRGPTDRKHILNRHQKRLIYRVTLRLRYVTRPSPQPTSDYRLACRCSESSPSNAFNALPMIIGVSSPGNSYWYPTTRALPSQPVPTAPRRQPCPPCSGTPRCTAHPTWRANRMCSRVCGIGPSAADTTRIAPSICAAPVIMFFT